MEAHTLFKLKTLEITAHGEIAHHNMCSLQFARQQQSTRHVTYLCYRHHQDCEPLDIRHIRTTGLYNHAESKRDLKKRRAFSLERSQYFRCTHRTLPPISTTRDRWLGQRVMKPRRFTALCLLECSVMSFVRQRQQCT